MTYDPQEAARRSIDPERLLPGKDSRSLKPEDAAHWVRVYSELRVSKQGLANELTNALERSANVARAELESVDMVLIQVQLERFERRLKYWLDREQELISSAAPAGR